MAFVDKIKNILLGTPDVDDYDDEEFFEEEEEEIYSPKSKTKSSRPALTLVDNPVSSRSSSYSSYQSLNSSNSFPTARDLVVATISPKNCEEAMMIIDRIKDGNLVIFSLKKVKNQEIEELTVLPGGGEEESKESIFKFICGGIYTLNAEISKFDEGVFIAGPSGCKIDEITSNVRKNIKTSQGTTTQAFRKGIF